MNDGLRNPIGFKIQGSQLPLAVDMTWKLGAFASVMVDSQYITILFVSSLNQKVKF